MSLYISNISIYPIVMLNQLECVELNEEEAQLLRIELEVAVILFNIFVAVLCNYT